MSYNPLGPQDWNDDNNLSWQKNYILYTVIILGIIFAIQVFFSLLSREISTILWSLIIGFVIGILFCLYREVYCKKQEEKKNEIKESISSLIYEDDVREIKRHCDNILEKYG
jgi:uncharacterized membrane protein